MYLRGGGVRKVIEQNCNRKETITNITSPSVHDKALKGWLADQWYE